MIIRVEVQQHATPDTYWQLTRCQVQRGMFMEDVRDPASFRSMQFATLEETVRHAKRATFAYLQQVRHKKMPDHIDWRIIEDARLFPCPMCQQPLYQKAKLGRLGSTIDLDDWGCSGCQKTITLRTDELVGLRSLR